MTKVLSQSFIISNVDKSSKVRRETLDDIEHVVVPVIAAQQMVMNGLFYPARS